MEVCPPPDGEAQALSSSVFTPDSGTMQFLMPIYPIILRLVEARRFDDQAVVSSARKLLMTASGRVRKSGQPYDPRKLQPA